MPIFSSRNKVDKWAKEILINPEIWLKKNGKTTPVKENVDPSTASFVFALDALLWGQYYNKHTLIVTASSVTAIMRYIHARGVNVWMADDPEAVNLWKTGGIPRNRTVGSNVGSLAVIRREWGYLLDKLETSNLYAQKNSNTDKDIEKILEVWKSAEMNLLHPIKYGEWLGG
ncbi:MAG: hypothetical protein SD837_09755 [Candidatus Electrothrix scaldis]|nr:MAG: hypothetical protein SD837_09755 [Candidatus Electrothrix sp. GW3-3]